MLCMPLASNGRGSLTFDINRHRTIEVIHGVIRVSWKSVNLIMHQAWLRAKSDCKFSLKRTF